MKINKIILGLICAAQGLHAMQGVREKINEVIEFIRTNNDYDATVIPEGFNSEKWGEIIQFDEEKQYAFTHIGNVYHYNGFTGWHCIHYIDLTETPKKFEQSFNTADRQWKGKVFDYIYENIYRNFIYNQPTQTCIFSVNKNVKNRFHNSSSNPCYCHNQLVIEQNQKQQIIDVAAPLFSDIAAIACSNDVQYCAYGRNWELSLFIKEKNSFVKIFKLSPNGIYEDVDSDMMTKGDSERTKEFKLLNMEHKYTLKNLKFLPNNSVQVHTVIPFYDKDYLWTINPKGIKTKQECFIKLENNQLQSLSKIYNLSTLYKKVSEGPYRYQINDPRFSAFINIVKDRNSGDVEEKKVSLSKELYAKIAATWYDIDSTLRENTTVIYNCKNLSEEEKQQLKQHLTL